MAGGTTSGKDYDPRSWLGGADMACGMRRVRCSGLDVYQLRVDVVGDVDAEAESQLTMCNATRGEKKKNVLYSTVQSTVRWS